MAKFKCLDQGSEGNYITAGCIYFGRDDGDGVLLYADDSGRQGWYLRERFVEVPEAPAPSEQPQTGLPTDAKARKAIPICTGCLDYFPDALAAVAEVSRIGNEQHNPGQPLHWARGKSTDQEDALLRHLIDRGKLDTDGSRHSAKVAWRALALLQLEIEAERGSK